MYHCRMGRQTDWSGFGGIASSSTDAEGRSLHLVRPGVSIIVIPLLYAKLCLAQETLHSKSGSSGKLVEIIVLLNSLAIHLAVKSKATSNMRLSYGRDTVRECM